MSGCSETDSLIKHSGSICLDIEVSTDMFSLLRSSSSSAAAAAKLATRTSSSSSSFFFRTFAAPIGWRSLATSSRQFAQSSSSNGSSGIIDNINSSSSGGDDTNHISSNQQFRNIVPDPKILDYLDTIKLGICNKRRQRVAVARKFEDLEKNPLYKKQLKDRYHLPFPFQYPAVMLGKVAQWGQLPVNNFENPPAEVAVIGRSNVGKSSLLNSLCGYNDSFVQKSSVSDRPGETQSLNFYGLGSKVLINKYQREINKQSNTPRYLGKLITTQGSGMCLVDMPGYGFAYMSDHKRPEINKLIQSYLLYRGPQLKRVLLLLDGRHGFKVGDKEFFRELFGSMKKSKSDSDFQLFQDIQGVNDDESAKGGEGDSNVMQNKANIHWKLQIVLTKCDLVERNDLARRIMQIRDAFDDMLPGLGNNLQIVATSSFESKGFIDLKKQLASLAIEADYSLLEKIQAVERERWLKSKELKEKRLLAHQKLGQGQSGSKSTPSPTTPAPSVVKDVSPISSVIKDVSLSMRSKNLNLKSNGEEESNSISSKGEDLRDFSQAQSGKYIGGRLAREFNESRPWGKRQRPSPADSEGYRGGYRDRNDFQSSGYRGGRSSYDDSKSRNSRSSSSGGSSSWKGGSGGGRGGGRGGGAKLHDDYGSSFKSREMKQEFDRNNYRTRGGNKQSNSSNSSDDDDFSYN